METIKRFVNDKHMLADVQSAVIDILEKEIITNAYAGNDVKHLALAKHVIVKALQQLEAEYGIKPQGNDVDHTI